MMGFLINIEIDRYSNSNGPYHGNAMSAAIKPMTIQKTMRCLCKVAAVAQGASVAQAFGSRYSLRKASPRNTNVKPMSQGRSGSSSEKLLIQEPLIPSVSNKKGPAQQVDAVIPVINPATRDPLVNDCFISLDSASARGVDCSVEDIAQ
jgi:hypothetical protein